MADPESKPPEQKPTPTGEALEELSWEIPFARTIKTFFIREGKAVKHGWVAVIVIAGIVCYFTHSWTKRGVDAKISGLENNFNNQMSELRGQLRDAKQERDKYQMMLAPFEAMAIAKYTNAPMDQRLDLLASGMAAITRALSDIQSEKPKLFLTINGKTLTNVDNSLGAVVEGTPFPIKKSEPILLAACNPSKTTAEHAWIEIFCDVDPTNLISFGWQPQPMADFGRNHWVTVADNPTPQFRSFMASPLMLSTNYSSPSFGAIISVSADNSTTTEYAVRFIIQ